MRHQCPRCGRLNEDNGPLDVGRDARGWIMVELGGCQECGEEQCSASWWQMLGRVRHAEGNERGR